MTQAELARELGLDTTYGQKKISQIETDLVRPSAQEIDRLATVLKVPRKDLEAHFNDPGAHVALELFSRLAQAETPSVMAVCYSGPPKAFLEGPIRTKVIDAIRKQLSVAMFLPFPHPPWSGNVTSGSDLRLAGYYSRVWGSVLTAREKLKNELGDDVVRERIGIYCPIDPEKTGLIPPFLSRYSLLIETDENGHQARSLYLWIETLEVKRIHLIGTHEDDAALDQIETWEAFFNGVVAGWVKTNQLPSGVSGYWKRIADAAPPDKQS